MDLTNQRATCKDCAKYNDKRGYTGRGMCERYIMLVSPDAEICGRFTPKGRRKLSKAERRAIWEDAGGRCQYCGCEVRLASMEVDHVVPYICGGKDERSNMVCACHACNNYKHTYGVNGMRDQIERLPDKLMSDTTFKLAVRYGLVTITKKPVVFEFERRHGRVRECNECIHYDEVDNGCNLTMMHCNHGDICKEFQEKGDHR